MNASRFLLLFLLMLAMACLGTGSAWAGPGDQCFSGNGLPGTENDLGKCVEDPEYTDGVCISDPVYNVGIPEGGTGLISTFVQDVTEELTPISEDMYEELMSDTGFTSAVVAAMVLYIMFYGLSFAFGLVQLTVYDFMMRMIKVGAVATIVNGTFGTYFSKTFFHFFNDGTVTLVSDVASMTGGGDPFGGMDGAIVSMTSIRTLITLVTLLTTGPYGWVVVLLLGISMYTFVKAMLYAVWVYLFSMTMRAILFGLAPLFIAFSLFSRTRQLFDGWLNQVVNSCLQPIFLYTFFSFFIQMVEGALNGIFSADICWTEIPVFVGGPDIDHFWRFAPGGVPFSGEWGLGTPPAVSLMVPLSIWLLADIANRANVTVVKMAKDIANASTGYDFRGQVFGGGGGGGTGGGSAVADPNAAKRAPLAPRDLSRPVDGRSVKATRDKLATLTGKRDAGKFS